jgi:8-oxo-dGTP pyrophosphatase MutT (NUDIX family)
MSDVRLAASVILVRRGERGALELYMTRRSAASAFAPDAYVFPGGTVDESDRSQSQRWPDGPDEVHLRDEFRARVPPQLPSSEPPVELTDAQALIHAALRELEEEAGIRLTDARRLALFSHWITPPAEPRRYNTHFFLAAAPADQTARPDRYETRDGLWIAPARALARHRSGSFHLVYPTIKHLERLAGFDSVSDALAFARSKPILTIMPAGTRETGFSIPAELENQW